MRNRIPYLVTIAFLFCGANLFILTTQSQNTPFTMGQILKALALINDASGARKKSLTERVLGDIRRRKVDFQVSQENEKLLRDEGATTDFIETIRQNFFRSSSISQDNNSSKRGKTSQLPLLAAQLRLLSVDKDGKEFEVAPFVAFTPNDRLRLSVKANQTGYLYVIRQASPEADGEIIFPTRLVNNGSNLIKANVEYILPRNCPAEYVPKPRDCALQLFPYEQSPQEYFTLIFTRDSLIDLPNDVKNKRVSLDSLMNAGKISSKTIAAITEDSDRNLVTQQGDTPYGLRVVNTNSNDNEEIIQTYVLAKMKQ